MFAVAYKRTMDGAKFSPAKPAVQVVNLVEVREARARELAAAEAEARARREAAIREQKAIADEMIRRGRAVALKLRLQDEGYRPGYHVIERRICRAMKISRAELYSDRQTRRIAMARHAIMYWTCRLTVLSLPQIGQRMGKDHTTIINGQSKYPLKRAAQGRYLRPAR